MKKDGNTHFIGMGGIGGVVAIGMENMFLFMDGYEEGDGLESYNEDRYIPLFDRG